MRSCIANRRRCWLWRTFEASSCSFRTRDLHASPRDQLLFLRRVMTIPGPDQPVAAVAEALRAATDVVGAGPRLKNGAGGHADPCSIAIDHLLRVLLTNWVRFENSLQIFHLRSCIANRRRSCGSGNSQPNFYVFGNSRLQRGPHAELPFSK